MDRVVVDLAQALERREQARVAGLITQSVDDVLTDLGAIDGAIRTAAPLRDEDIRKVVRFLGNVMCTGLFGIRARTWAASLLLHLRTRGSAISPEDQPTVDEAAAALAAFDAVAYGTATPSEMRRFILEKTID